VWEIRELGRGGGARGQVFSLDFGNITLHIQQKNLARFFGRMSWMLKQVDCKSKLHFETI